MVFLNSFSKSSILFLKNLIDFNTRHLNFEFAPELSFYIKFSITVYNVLIFFLLFFFLLNFIFSLFFKAYSFFLKVIKYLNLLIITILLILLVLKLFISLKVESVLGVFFYQLKLDFFLSNSNLNFFEHFAVLSTSFSDAILILSFIVGLVCLELLGSKNLFSSLNNISIFFLFNFFVTIMVSSNNLLIMFLSFEFIFFPTVYFAYSLGYTKKIDNASEMLIYWTLFGSFLVLCNLGYLFYKFNTLNYLFLCQKNFSKTEITFLFFNFLLGFGIKIPIAPFHYWLLKVHVESPTAFSIYLSGFLVKSALYCLYMFISIFNNPSLYLSFTLWILYSLVIGTLGLARQVDIKKLIAWATVQEMSFMLIFLVFKQLFFIHSCILFVLLHGLMSSYMFFIVDILQRRYKTRSLQYITGLNLIFPELTKYIWFLILLFSGFPLTIKFFIEWNLISLLLETNKFLLIFLLFFVNFLGVVFFCKIMFSILYGTPSNLVLEEDFVDIQKKEKTILKMLIYVILLLLLILYFV